MKYGNNSDAITPWSVFYPGPYMFDRYVIQDVASEDFGTFLWHIWNHIQTSINWASTPIREFILPGVWSNVSIFEAKGTFEPISGVINVTVTCAYEVYFLYWGYNDATGWDAVARTSGSRRWKDPDATLLPGGSNLNYLFNPGTYLLSSSLSYPNYPYEGSTRWLKIIKWSEDYTQTIYDLYGRPLAGRYGWKNFEGVSWVTF